MIITYRVKLPHGYTKEYRHKCRNDAERSRIFIADSIGQIVIVKIEQEEKK